MFGREWAQSYRNSRALLLAILLLPVGIYALFFHDEVVSTAKDTGKIIEISISPIGNRTAYSGLVELRDGTRIQLPLKDPVPEKNEMVPLIVRTYAGGKIEYSLDVDEWRFR